MWLLFSSHVFLVCVCVQIICNTYINAILFSFEVTLTSIISKSLKFWHYCNAWSILSTYKYVDVCMMEILDLFLNFECIFICSLTVKTENKLQLRLEDYITNLLLMFLYTYTSTYVLLLSACTMKRFQTLMNVVKIMETKD